MLSLNARLLIATSAILSSFFGLAGVVLDRTYHESVESALTERLEGHVYALIASAEVDEEGGFFMPTVVPDSRFSDPTSGMYAEVSSNRDGWAWQSLSVGNLDIPFPRGLKRLQRVSKHVTLADGQQLYIFSYGVVWSDSPDPGQAHTFSVALDMETVNAQVLDFRRRLWGSLGGVALMLLAVQRIIVRWGLAPLRKAEEELCAVEEGQQPRIQGTYPPELEGLTNNINGLLSHQQQHLERYRHTLGDLAHSLKTPLAILQSASESRASCEEIKATVKEQVERMNQITGYQLQKAATSGWTVLAAPINVTELARKVVAGLQKVYGDKSVQARMEMKGNPGFHGDEGDLMEIVGNLVDNAFKWCKKQVNVTAESTVNETTGEEDLFLRVEDDGSGVPAEMVRYVMQRGRRADSDMAGHGIGLSIVRDIVQLYGGSFEISVSDLGGAAMHVWLPARPKEQLDEQPH
jgi:two-component system sensor histidine kinase PhoQ